MSSTLPKVIIITGCSSGIGRASAEALATRGHVVYATARRVESVSDLRVWAANYPNNAFACKLDVTREEEIQSIIQQVIERHGRIDCLINNAGFGQPGTMEDVTSDQWRHQLETNLIGPMATTRAALPAMRHAHTGRIINVSSVVAHITAPMMGAYCASKHALEAASCALRMEVARMGIDVVLIEPGPIATSFRTAVADQLATKPITSEGPYHSLYEALRRYRANQNETHTTGPEAVARSIIHAVESSRPRLRYRITPTARLGPLLTAIIPERLLDRLMTTLLLRHYPAD